MTTPAATSQHAATTAEVTRHDLTIPTPSGDKLAAWLYLPSSGSQPRATL